MARWFVNGSSRSPKPLERRRQREIVQDQLQVLPAADLAIELLDAGEHRALFRAAQDAGDRHEGTALARHFRRGGVEQAVDVEPGHDDGLLDLRDRQAGAQGKLATAGGKVI